MSGTRLVAREELRDTWLRGWAPWLVLAITLAYSAVAVGLAYSNQLNLLDAKEGLAIVVRMSAGVGILLVVLIMADSISGMRERSTLEAVLLTPLRHQELAAGKLLAAIVAWAVAFVISVPYLYVIGQGVGRALIAVVSSLAVGFSMAVLLGAGAGWLSVRSRSNLQSLGTGLVILAILTIPMLLPAAVLSNPVGEFLQRIDPLSAANHLINALIIDERAPFSEIWWMISPVAGTLLVLWLFLAQSERIELEPGT